MWVAYAVIVALIVAAALFDWQARRQGRTQQTSADYWAAVRDARREARSRLFGRRH